MKLLKEKIKGLLLRSQKFTRVDMLYVVKGGASLTIATVAAGFFSFLLSIAFANLVSQEIYGTYRFILSVAGVIGTFTLTGVGIAVARSVSQGKVGILLSAAKTYLAWNMIPLFIALGAAGWYFFHDNYTLMTAMLLIAVLAPVNNTLGLHNAWFSGKKEFRQLASNRIAQSALHATLLISLLFLTNNPLFLLLGFYVPQIIISLIFFPKVLKRFPAELFNLKDKIYAKHLTAMNLISSLAVHIDKVIVFHFLGASQTAIYVFALALPNQLRGIAKNISTLALPKLAEKNIDNARKGMRRKTLILGGIFGASAIVYIFAAPHLFKWFFPAYLESVPYSQVLAINVFLTGLALLPNTLLTAQAALKEKYLLGFLIPGTQIALMLLLVVPYGIWGIIFALLFAKTSGATLTLFLAQKAR